MAIVGNFRLTHILIRNIFRCYFEWKGSRGIFSKGDPNQIYVYLKLPVGTAVEYTDSVTHLLEDKVEKVLGIDNGKKNPVVESVITNVAVGSE